MIATILATAALQSTSLTSGQDVLSVCKDRTVEVYCFGYITGLSDGLAASALLNRTEKPYCLPDNITAAEMRNALVAGLEQRRDLWAGNGVAATIIVLRQAFPCGTTQAPPTGQ